MADNSGNYSRIKDLQHNDSRIKLCFVVLLLGRELAFSSVFWFMSKVKYAVDVNLIINYNINYTQSYLKCEWCFLKHC